MHELKRAQVRSVLDGIRFEDWKFWVTWCCHQDMLNIQKMCPNNFKDDDKKESFTFRFVIPEDLSASPEDVTGFVMGKIEKIVLHEAQEKFKYNDERIFNPHKERAGLWADTSRLALTANKADKAVTTSTGG